MKAACARAKLTHTKKIFQEPNMVERRNQFTDEEALRFHSKGKPGKIEITATKPMATQRDLSLAYSPGVAVPVRAIAETPEAAYDYTAKGNLVAVISNGTAILGLGNLGALASKPVMEGKAVLFKRFADVDSIDIEVNTEDADEFINCVRFLEPTFGGINLEDIKAPECFIIEQRLREVMNIPVFHDDQHGTAIIAAAGLINALHLTGKDIKDIKMVVNGAGSAGIACLELVKAMGLPHDQGILCDTKGVIYQGRKEGMNQWKSAHAATTDARTLEEAMDGADVVFGLSVQGALTQKMIQSMAAKPIIFAMANPDPEITPEEVASIRDDAIMATGRSDYPNQVNNVLGFPYIFRGALDVHATTINEQMKIAAAGALASLAREDVPDEVAAAYHGRRPKYGPDYIIPAPFDPRLISHVAPAVATAAMESGVARRPIVDLERYQEELNARLDPTASLVQFITSSARARPKRIVFAEGEQESVIRAALAFKSQGLGTPVLIGREKMIEQTAQAAGLEGAQNLEVHNARYSDWNPDFADLLYSRWQRRGMLQRDAERLVNTDRNTFAACMVALGHADGMVTGVTRNYATALRETQKVIDPQADQTVIGTSIVLARGRTVFVSDTSVTEMPTPQRLVDIAIQTARVARRFNHVPRVAFLAYSTFGNPPGERSDIQREAVELLDKIEVDFEYEGEMSADVALEPDPIQYPFSRLTGPANCLVMPAFHSASIGTKLLQVLGECNVIGPMLSGLEKPVQICPLGAKVNDIVTMAALAAYDISNIEGGRG
jgi:malate dehydrogenase (oxaloacetate-decarboxylating)(NADP+)